MTNSDDPVKWRTTAVWENVDGIYVAHRSDSFVYECATCGTGADSRHEGTNTLQSDLATHRDACPGVAHDDQHRERVSYMQSHGRPMAQPTPSL